MISEKQILKETKMALELRASELEGELRLSNEKFNEMAILLQAMEQELEKQADELEDARTQIEQGVAMKEGLELFISEIQEELMLQKSCNDELQSTLHEKSGEADSLRATLLNKEDEHALILKKVQELQSQLPKKLNAARKQLEEAFANLVTVRENASESEKKCSDLEILNSNLMADLKVINNTMDAHLRTIEDLNETNQSLLERIDEVKTENGLINADYESHFQQQEKEAANLRKLLHSSRQQNDDLAVQHKEEESSKQAERQQQIYELLTNVQEITAERDVMREDLLKAREMNASLQNKLADNVAESQGLKKANDSFSEAIANLQLTLQKREAALQEEMATSAELKQYKNELQQEIGTVCEDMIRQKEDMKTSYQEKLSVVVLEHDELQEKLKERECALKQQKQKSAELKEHTSELQQELGTISDTMICQKEEFSIQAEELMQSVQEKKAELASIKKLCDDLEDALEQNIRDKDLSEDANQKLTEELGSLNQSFGLSRVEFDNVKTEVAALGAEIAEKDKMISTLQENYRVERSISSQVCFEIEQSFMREQNLSRVVDELVEADERMQRTCLEMRTKSTPIVSKDTEIIVINQDQQTVFTNPIVIPDIRDYPCDLINSLMKNTAKDALYASELGSRVLEKHDQLAIARIEIRSRDMVLDGLEADLEEMRDERNKLEKDLGAIQDQNAELVENLDRSHAQEDELHVELESLRANHSEIEHEEIDILSTFICNQGLGNFFLKQHVNPRIFLMNNVGQWSYCHLVALQRHLHLVNPSPKVRRRIQWNVKSIIFPKFTSWSMKRRVRRRKCENGEPGKCVQISTESN